MPSINPFGGAVSTNPIGPYSETLVAVAASDVDLSTGNYFTKTLSGNITFTFSNPLTNVSFFTLRIKNSLTGGFSIIFPASVTLIKDGALPTPTDDDIYVFLTEDGGTSYTGTYVGAYS